MTRRTLLASAALAVAAVAGAACPASAADVNVTSCKNLQSKADQAAGGRLIFTPLLSCAVTNLSVKANTYVVGNGATLKYPDRSTASTTSDSILKVDGSGVTVDGLKFDGRQQAQNGVWSQHRHSVRILGAHSNVTVKNGTFTNIIGDGVYVNTGAGSNINVLNNTMTGNYANRNGISIVTGTDVEVAGNTLTNLTRPGMPGPIDIEPNSSGETLRDVFVHDNTIRAGTTPDTGYQVGIMYAGFNNAAASNILIQSNDIAGTRLDAGLLAIGINGGPMNAVTGLKFDGNSIHDIGGSLKIGIELDYWIRADVTRNNLNGMEYGIYNYRAALGDTTGNVFTNVARPITEDGAVG